MPVHSRKARISKSPKKVVEKNKFSPHHVGMLDKLIKSLVGGLIGFALTGLFGMVVLAFVAKSFLVGDEMAGHLLNSAITIVGTTLGTALGYFLGKNINEKDRKDR